MEECLCTIKILAENKNMNVAIPYGIGCGIANGNWNKVYEIIKNVFEKNKVECVLYKL